MVRPRDPGPPPTPSHPITAPRRPPRVGGLLPRLLGAACGAYVRFVYATTRWRLIGRDHLEEAITQGAFVGACWHARISALAMLRPKDRRAVALISASRDGDFLQNVMAAMGVWAIRGSSQDPRKTDKNKGGSAAAASLTEALRSGAIVVITPDGPRGPRMRVKPGAAAVAAVAGAPLLPITCAFGRATLLGTWDRFMIPWPFGRGVFIFGELIDPGAPGDRAAQAAACERLEASLNALTEQADRLVGRTLVAPAEAKAARRAPRGSAAAAEDGAPPAPRPAEAPVAGSEGDAQP